MLKIFRFMLFNKDWFVNFSAANVSIGKALHDEFYGNGYKKLSHAEIFG